MSQTDTVEFDLVENAKDSLVHGVRHLSGKEGEGQSPGDLKRAVRDVVHALELLVKERLRREHPSLLRADFRNYNRMTVGLEEAITRLQKDAHVSLDADVLRTIEDARSKRNEIEHCRFEISLDEARLTVERVLSFVFRFAREELHDDLTAYMQAHGLRAELRKLEKFWQDHAERTRKHLVARGRRTLTCPSCDFETFDDEEGKCQHCGAEGGERLTCDGCRQGVWQTHATFIDGEGTQVLMAVGGVRTLCESCRREEPDASDGRQAATRRRRPGRQPSRRT